MLGLAFALFRRARRGEPRGSLLVLVGVLAVTTVALGLATYLPCVGGQAPFIAPISWALGLFVGIGGVAEPAGLCEGEVPLALQLARVLGLATTFVGAVAAGLVIGRQQLDRLRVRVSRDVDVVVGLDVIALPLVQSLLRQAADQARSIGGRRRRRVVVVEPNPAHPMIDEARRAGATIIHADPTSARSMAAVVTRADHQRLRRLFAVSASSGTNRRVVSAVQDALLTARSRRDGRLPRLVARLDDPREAEDWRLRKIESTGSWVVDAISAYETTAVLLAEAIMAAGCQRLVLVGDTTLSHALLHEVARRRGERAALAVARPTLAPPTADQVDPATTWSIDLVVVAGTSPDEIREEWLHVAPRYRGARGDSSPAYEFVAGDLARAHEIVEHDPLPCTVVVVTEARDEVVRNGAGRLARLHPEVVVHVRSDAQAAGLAPEPSHDRLHIFGLTLLPSASPPEDSWTRLARLHHEVYIRREHGADEPPAATHLPWIQLDDSVREDNLRQIRAQIEQIARLGYVWRSDQEPRLDGVAESDLIQLCALEHERWLDVRRSEGWQYGAKRDDATKRSPYLVPWHELSTTHRRRTVEGVQGVVERMATLGLTPRRREFRRVGEVRARRLAEDLTWTSTHGDPMRGRAGDWVISEPGHSDRTIAAARFGELHEPIGGDRYRRRGIVHARPVSFPTSIDTLEGSATAQPGDWIVHGPGGEVWPVPATDFVRSYKEIT